MQSLFSTSDLKLKELTMAPSCQLVGFEMIPLNLLDKTDTYL